MATTLTETQTEYVPKAWETVNCLFCGSSESKTIETFGPQERYHYVRCADCGLTYLNPRPRYDQEFVDTAYNVYTTSVDDIWTNGKLNAEGERRAVRVRETLREMEAMLGRKGTLLEIGCHVGFFSKIAKDDGWRVTGVDISPSVIEIATKTFGIEARCGNWLEMSFPEQYDLVYCSHTIEHIPNPADWLEKFKQVMKPDGLLCLEVPNMQSIDRKFKRVLLRAGLKKNKWEAWRTPDHLYEPCERSFVPYLQKFGFKVMQISTYSRSKSPNNFLARLYNRQMRVGSNLRIYLKRS